MANNNLKTTNDILVKVDQNNLIYIDPNSVVSNGMAVPRSVQPENLIMYVNLEADLVPRSILVAGNDQNTLLSIAKGTLNFMKNPNGTDFDTKWTDAYTDIKSNTAAFSHSSVDAVPIINSFMQNDSSGQSFGIEKISIQVAGANFIPRVTINFIDVRGKTLFDSPENSPYAAFFHLPWPIFYLTVKGYYGKAIKYRLHQIKFNSRYNPATGNFEVESTLIGSTYAYMADIQLEAVLNAPYFFISENSTSTQFNEQTGFYDVTISKSTKGYRMLKSVYQEYINKGLLPKDFPIKTLREIIIIAGRLNKILEREIFDKTVDPKILSGVKEYEEQIQNFEIAIEGWKKQFLENPPQTFTIPGRKIAGTTNDILWYKMRGEAKNSLKAVTGSTIIGTLEKIVTAYVDLLENNQTFGVKRDRTLVKDSNFNIKTISLYQLKSISNFYTPGDGAYGVDTDGLIGVIRNVEVDFVQQRNKLENDIESKMNEIVRKKDIGIGFEPTVRNIVGVLLANAETYVRLMRDVHVKAFDQGQVRSKVLAGIPTDSDIPTQAIYPWPEIKAQTAGDKELVLVYPGGKEMADKLDAFNTTLWPEVDFVENFYEVATKKADNLTTKEGSPENINYIFSTGINLSKKEIGVLTSISGYLPYGDKSISSILYEIYERAKYVSSVSPFGNDVMIELGGIEFDNLQAQISEDVDIIDTLKAFITSYDNLLNFMGRFSPFERYPYFQDQLPTVPYIKDTLAQDFSVKKYEKNLENQVSYEEPYTALVNFLSNYKPEDYRTQIYPFNSSTYNSYRSFASKNLNISGLLKTNPPEDFIASALDPSQYIWVKNGYNNNLFTNLIKISGATGNQYKHILNTPYFHKQLYDDFTKSQSAEKYVGSAYLLLNSLPFKDLDDTMNNSDTLVSSMFREIGATHYIPYHMMVKWGSIYHRYKRYINDSIDIINNVAAPIDNDIYFDNGFTGRTYTGTTTTIVSGLTSGQTVTISNQNDIGFHPFYEDVFHQVVNGYGYFDQIVGPTSYYNSLLNGVTKTIPQIADGGNSWTIFIDESIFDSTDKRYTLLPTNGYNDINATSFNDAEQENFRILWNIGTSYNPNFVDYGSYIFPRPNEYFKLTGSTDTYSLDNNYRKVIDLIATFKPDILDTFEAAFLDFASERLNEEIPYKPYDVNYSKFQDLLKDIVSISKNDNDPSDNKELFILVKGRQTAKLVSITDNMLSADNFIKVTLGNPREINTHILGGFTDTNLSHNFSVGAFDASQLPGNINNITLYLGEDLDGFYQDFFQVNNIEVNEDNIKQFRPLIYDYAGMRASGESPSKADFINHLKNTIILPVANGADVSGQEIREVLFLTRMIERIQKDLKTDKVQGINKKRGYSDDIIKLELYNMFKSFNDKWTSGNSIGQRTLMEEFLFLDKANRDIGDSVYIDMEKLMRLTDDKNSKINLFSAISLLVQDTGFDIRALPAYVNFYGTTLANPTKTIPSRNVAQNMFGSFLEVDTVDSSPKIILQYIGPTSKHLELSDIDKKYKYKNDAFNIGDVNNNPIIIASGIFNRVDLSKSNKVVAFEVSFGDQNQSIFKGVELDQTSIKNTSESFAVLERLGRSETGSSTAQIDIGLFDIYRSSSYQCTVSCMGDVMIQPTMYFYLKNIPLFRGSYWITEVTHTIKTTGIETSFKGSRIPLQSLPNPTDSFLASYRSLFDKLIKRATTKVKESDLQSSGKSTTENVLVTDAGSFAYDLGSNNPPKGEDLVKESGVTEYGIPYNGFDGEKYIQLVSYQNPNVKWLRAVAVRMGGSHYPIDTGTTMNILTRLTVAGVDTPGNVIWSDLMNQSASQDFYVTRFNLGRVNADYLTQVYNNTQFLNPNSIHKLPMMLNTSISIADKKYQGPVSVGPSIPFETLQTISSKPAGAGIGLSESLMKKLGLNDGDIVYFRLSKRN